MSYQPDLTPEEAARRRRNNRIVMLVILVVIIVIVVYLRQDLFSLVGLAVMLGAIALLFLGRAYVKRKVLDRRAGQARQDEQAEQESQPEK